MKKELHTAWIAALRSGKYKQGKGLLCTTENKYCCLGVLAEVAGFKSRQLPYILAKQFLYKNESAYSTLTKTMLLELHVPENKAYTLVLMNDSQNKSFLEIADYIEKNISTTD